MTTTRPTEYERRLQASETAARASPGVDDERAFREHTLISLARMSVKMDVMTEDLKDHIDSDERKFGAISQSIGVDGRRLYWILGIGAGAIGVSGIAMWIISRSSP